MVRGIGGALLNSPRSGCREAKIAANGHSRHRVKMCQHLKCILWGMKKSGTAETDIVRFRLFDQQGDESVFLLM